MALLVPKAAQCPCPRRHFAAIEFPETLRLLQGV